METGIAKIFIFFLILLLGFSIANGADLTNSYLKSKPGGNSLDKKRWENLKDDYKYKSPKADTTRQKTGTPVRFSMYGDAGWFKLIAWIIVFLIIGAIIYMLARFGFLGEKNKKNISIPFDINKEPTDINDLDIDPLLIAALKNKDYRLAIRLKFLALLQLLNNNKRIIWKRNKTNREYIYELKDFKFHVMFRQLCLIYESAWYGNYPINEAGYQIAVEKFAHISIQITDKAHV